MRCPLAVLAAVETAWLARLTRHPRHIKTSETKPSGDLAAPGCAPGIAGAARGATLQLHALETTRDAKRDRPSAFPTPDTLVELLFAQNSLRGGEIRKVYARTHRQSPPRILCFQLSTAGGSGEAAGKTYTGHTQEDLAGGAELGARDVNSRDVNSKTGSSRSKHPLPQASGGVISGMWAPCASVICFVSV